MGLRALRLSLNAPVVDLVPLPVGPASAAIALREGPGSPQVTIALRTDRGGERLLFGEDGSSSADSELLLDAALSFAESMGFLFDDDLVESRGDDGPEEAARVWREWLGAGPETPAPGAPPELLLDEPLDGQPRAAAPAGGAGPTLTKFRRASGASNPEPPAPRPPAAPAGGRRLELLSRF